MKNIPKDFTLDHRWPSGLPTRCEHCENAYDKRFSLEVGPGRIGRLLRRNASWLSVVMFFIVLGMHVRTGDLGRVLPIPVIILLPSLVLYIFGGLLPIKTRLHCFKCNRASYFNPPDEWSSTSEERGTI